MTADGILSVSRYQAEWAMLGLALLILGTLTGFSLYTEHTDIDGQERDRLQTQAQVIEENLGHQLKGMSNALAGVLTEFPQPVIETMRPEASRHLKALTDAMPGVHAMFILDAKGTVLAANRANTMAGLNFSHREYFEIPRERPNATTLYVSSPFETVSGVFSLNVSRVMTNSNGAFAGIVTATLDPDYFNVVLRSVLYAPDMVTSLVHADGKVFVVMPRSEQRLGKDLSMPGSNFSRFKESGQTAAVMTGIVYATGEERMRALRTVKRAELHMDKPLVIIIDRSVSAIFASWRSKAFTSGTVYALFAAAAGFGLYLSQRRRKRYPSGQVVTPEVPHEGAEKVRHASK